MVPKAQSTENLRVVSQPHSIVRPHYPETDGSFRTQTYRCREMGPVITTWSPLHQRGAKVAVQRAFRWSEKMGVIDTNPIRYLEKPEAGKREQVIAPEQYPEILEYFKDESFRSLLEMAWHTGARPQECIRIEARHVELQNRRIVLPPKEAKGKKRFRIIYLNDDVLALVRRLAETYQVGTIFRNLKGRPWTAWAVNNRFCRFQLHKGRLELRQRGFTLDPDQVREHATKLRAEKSVRGKVLPKDSKELKRRPERK